jgi:hypothetical protein
MFGEGPLHEARLPVRFRIAGALAVLGLAVAGCGQPTVVLGTSTSVSSDSRALQANLDAQGSAEMRWVSRTERFFAPTPQGRQAFEASIGSHWLPWPKITDLRAALAAGRCVWNAGPASSFEWGSWPSSTVLRAAGSPIDSVEKDPVELTCPAP